MKKTAIFLLLGIFILSCSTGRISDLELDDNEAIVTGVYRVFFNGMDVTALTNIYFNETKWGLHRYSSRDHFLVTKLPLGINCIAGVSFESNIIDFDPGYITFRLEDREIANCIGYIEIRLYGSGYEQSSYGLNQVSLGSNHSGNAGVRLKYDDDIEQEVRQKFHLQFGTGMMIKETPVNLDPDYMPG